jgi:predicted ThiF/HesA family dinucleotide-utilizing enzyme
MCVFCNQEENEPSMFTQADGCKEVEHPVIIVVGGDTNTVRKAVLQAAKKVTTETVEVKRTFENFSFL